MNDPLDPSPRPASKPGTSYEGERRPRPKKSGSIWATAIVVMFLVIVGGYILMHWRGTTDPAPGGPRAGSGATTSGPSMADHD